MSSQYSNKKGKRPRSDSYSGPDDDLTTKSLRTISTEYSKGTEYSASRSSSASTETHTVQSEATSQDAVDNAVGFSGETWDSYIAWSRGNLEKMIELVSRCLKYGKFDKASYTYRDFKQYLKNVRKAIGEGSGELRIEMVSEEGRGTTQRVGDLWAEVFTSLESKNVEWRELATKCQGLANCIMDASNYLHGLGNPLQQTYF
jgi:phosphoribosyl-ATP pyrophosphohydrolase